MGFVVSHALAPSGDWGETPHLDGGSPLEFAQFAARCAALDAFREAGIGMPPLALSQVRIQADAGARTLWVTHWCTTESTAQAVAAAGPELGEALNCEVSQVHRTRTPSIFCLVFGHAGVADEDRLEGLINLKGQ